MLSSLEHYYVPETGKNSLTEVRNYITNMPIDEDPRVFALHPNALITAQIEYVRMFIQTVESVQPRSTGGAVGKKPEDMVADLANEILDKLPAPMKKKNAHEDTYAPTPEGGVVSLGVFHEQEMGQFNRLNKVVKESCELITKAVKGLVVMG